MLILNRQQNLRCLWEMSLGHQAMSDTSLRLFAFFAVPKPLQVIDFLSICSNISMTMEDMFLKFIM